MSRAYTEAVWASTIASPVRWLLLALADHADQDGECWPSIETLRLELGLRTKHPVYDALQRAERAGYLHRVSGGGRSLGGRGVVNRYRLDLDALNGAARDTVPRARTVQPTTKNGVAHDTRTVQPATPRTVIEPPGNLHARAREAPTTTDRLPGEAALPRHRGQHPDCTICGTTVQRPMRSAQELRAAIEQNRVLARSTDPAVRRAATRTLERLEEQLELLLELEPPSVAAPTATATAGSQP